MPTDELDVAQLGPEREEDLERVVGASVDGEGVDQRKGDAEAIGDVVGVDGVRQEVGAPGGDEGEVQVGNAVESGGDPVEIADVAAEGQGGARGSLQGEVLATHQGQRIPGSRVRHEHEDARQYHVRQLVYGGGALPRRLCHPVSRLPPRRPLVREWIDITQLTQRHRRREGERET